MEDRQKRQQHLLKLLKSRTFSNQDDVVTAMSGAGYEVTQSSISRDFKELGVVKLGDRYTPGETLKANARESTLQRMIRGFDNAGPHLLVVKTSPGAAPAVAEEIDDKEVDGIAGTVAGDNTIFIATKSRAAQLKIINYIKQLR